MSFNYKKINMGSLIRNYVTEQSINMDRICNFFNCTEDEIQKMYQCYSMDTEALLRWSKLLNYDFFRIYSHHILLYAPPKKEKNDGSTGLPKFRKSVYTKELINFILNQIDTGKMTRSQVINEYGIPKTTLSKWITKYKNEPPQL